MKNIINEIIQVKSFVIVLQKKMSAVATELEEQCLLSTEGFPRGKFYNKNGISVVIFSRGVCNSSGFLDDKINLLVGDPFEVSDTSFGECMGHSALANINFDEGTCHIFTSIIGLPPIFHYKDSNVDVFTTDIFLLKQIKNLKLDFDCNSLVDLCKVGHTVKNRTLFNNVVMLKAGIKMSWDPVVGVKKYDNFTFRDIEIKNWDQYIEMQIEKFYFAISNIDLERCFLSLTAGLDTRAILSVLSDTNKKVNIAYTVSGKQLSLDAIIAKKLCDHYGISHVPIILDDIFFDNFEKFTYKASTFSGGIYSSEQAHEVFFYESVDKKYQGRLSGNMGNQIGRGGTEGVSMRNGNVSIIDRDFFCSIDRLSSDNHWFKDICNESGVVDFKSLIFDEIPNSSVGNYCIGNNYVVQKSPYAHRSLIEVARFKPRENKDQSLSIGRMKIKDLKHRIFGDAAEKSFQRKLISRNGGYAASCPINWGWRARGGVSVAGMVLGGGAALDSVILKMGIKNPIVKYLAKLSSVTGLHVYKHLDVWLKNYYKEFVCDTVLSARLDGILDIKSTRSLLDDFYKNKSEDYETVCFALNIAIAKKLFISKY